MVRTKKKVLSDLELPDVAVPPSGPLEIPDANGHSIGISQGPPASASSDGGSDDTFHDPFNTDPDALAAADAAADEQVEEAGLDISNLELNVAMPKSDENLLSLEEAAKRLGPKVLDVLDARFKGELSEVRHLDERDLIL